MQGGVFKSFWKRHYHSVTHECYAVVGGGSELEIGGGGGGAGKGGAGEDGEGQGREREREKGSGVVVRVEQGDVIVLPVSRFPAFPTSCLFLPRPKVKSCTEIPEELN